MPDLLLFAYGSLRRDARGEHHPLLAGAEFRGRATTAGRLYRVSWHPGLHLDAGGGPVTGDLFAIPEALRESMMQRLDEYEGDAFRLERTAAVTTDGARHDAFTYTWLGDASSATLVESGDFGVPPDHRSR